MVGLRRKAMSKEKILPDIAKCGCKGNSGLMSCSGGDWRVHCNECWILGPLKHGKKSAIHAWNTAITGKGEI